MLQCYFILLFNFERKDLYIARMHVEVFLANWKIYQTAGNCVHCDKVMGDFHERYDQQS